MIKIQYDKRYNPIFSSKKPQQKIKATRVQTLKCNGVEVTFDASENLVLPVKKD